MPHLPDPTGPYLVGATTFVRHISTPVPIGSSRTRNGHETVPTLLFEEVAFTIFAPTIDSKHAGGSWLSKRSSIGNKGVDWVSKPISETIKGYAHSSGRDDAFPEWLGALLRPLISSYGASIKIPAYENAPLRSPPDGKDRWPLAIFSHGLKGARTTYSVLCTRLASEGRVVIAIEHRDGTGPAVFARGRTILYINPDEVEWPDAKPVNPDLGHHTKGAHNSEQALRLRVDQLDLRRREVYEIVHAFSAMVSGAADHGGLSSMDGKNVDWSTWNGKVEVDQLDLIGHSFGGATLFSILSTAPSPLPGGSGHHMRLPIRRVLALDPWMEPFASAGPGPYKDAKEPKTAAPELLVINSEAFTLWTGHFNTLKETVARFAPSRLITLVRAQHITFSDFPLLVSRRLQGTDPQHLADRVGLLAHLFLTGSLSLQGASLGVEDEGIQTHSMETVKDKGRQRLVGAAGDIILH